MLNGRLKVVCTYPISHESILSQAIGWLMRYSNGGVTANFSRGSDESYARLIVEGPHTIMQELII